MEAIGVPDSQYLETWETKIHNQFLDCNKKCKEECMTWYCISVSDENVTICDQLTLSH